MARTILSNKRFNLTLNRLSHQIVENYPSLEDVRFIGIQEKGVIMAERIAQRLTQLYRRKVNIGKLDITFYRDDFRTREKPLRASSTNIDFEVEGKNVVLIDDVLYTGRSVHAGISAILDFGRPESIELMCMIDRRFNRHFPIKADYAGFTVDAVDEAYVRVEWENIDGEDRVLLLSAKEARNK